MKVYKTADSEVLPILSLGNTTYMLVKDKDYKRWVITSYESFYIDLVTRDNPSANVDELSSRDKKWIIKAVIEWDVE